MTLKLAFYVLITSMGIVAWKCALKHSFPDAHSRAKVRRNVLIGASHLLVLTAVWGATSWWYSLACSSSLFLSCLIFPTSLKYSLFLLQALFCSFPGPFLSKCITLSQNSLFQCLSLSLHMFFFLSCVPRFLTISQPIPPPSQGDRFRNGGS